MDKKLQIKTPDEMKIMTEGGKKLGRVKKKLMRAVSEGISASEIEELASTLIAKEGAKPSFQMVSGYSWATCVNINEGLVHGIPKKEVVFKKGDIISVDVGMFYKGFHTDTAFTVAVSPNKEINDFLSAGKMALKKAIAKAQPGNRIYDISKAIQTALENKKLSPIKAMVGHGVGKSLHEAPEIPCFVKAPRKKTAIIPKGAVLAIEVMYTKDSPEIEIDKDGWTIRVRSGKIAGLFEETVAVTSNGPIVLTT